MNENVAQAVATPSDNKAPIRGTQSFVGVMAAVWKRPSLIALGVLWRWAAGLPIPIVCAWEALRISRTVTIDVAALQAMTIFKPVESVVTIGSAVRALAPAVLPVLLWLVPLALALRILAAGIGRAALLRKLGASGRPSPWALFGLSALRTAALLLALAIWAVGVRWANRLTILRPMSHGAEPNIVLLAAFVVFGTLVLFMVWAISIWILDAAIVISAELGSGVFASIREALQLERFRSNLIEINLVMGIVKTILIVLAFVFSSCQVPFADLEPWILLAGSWAIIILLYVVVSDYFHVVYTAAYLALYKVYRPEMQAIEAVRK